MPSVAVAQNSDGRLEIFCVNSSDSKVYHNYQTAPHSSWSGWFSQGGAGITNLVAVTEPRRAVGSVWHLARTATSGMNGRRTRAARWTSSWSDHQGQHIKAGFTVGINGDGRLEMFGVGANGDVWHDYRRAPAARGVRGYIDFERERNESEDCGGVERTDEDARNSMASAATATCEHSYQIIGGGGAWNGWGDVGAVGAGAQPGMVVGSNPDGVASKFL